MTTVDHHAMRLTVDECAEMARLYRGLARRHDLEGRHDLADAYRRTADRWEVWA